MKVGSKGWCKESSLLAYMLSFSFITKYVHMLMTWSFHIVDKVKFAYLDCPRVRWVGVMIYVSVISS